MKILEEIFSPPPPPPTPQPPNLCGGEETQLINNSYSPFQSGANSASRHFQKEKEKNTVSLLQTRKDNAHCRSGFK